ncbi:MAG: hypothetical protein PHD73_09475 [Sediminibacterium sp.]|nr:hypothetical protein [Sediminibacterium sp.]
MFNKLYLLATLLFVALFPEAQPSRQWKLKTDKDGVQCYIVKQESPSSLYYYGEISMPWPVKNRDFIIKISMFQDE